MPYEASGEGEEGTASRAGARARAACSGRRSRVAEARAGTVAAVAVFRICGADIRAAATGRRTAEARSAGAGLARPGPLLPRQTRRHRGTFREVHRREEELQEEGHGTLP